MPKQYFYLIPGFFGFANLGELKSFVHVRDMLVDTCSTRGVAAQVVVVKTHPTASLTRRAACLIETIAATQGHTKSEAHIIGHSSGGLDARLATAPGVLLPTACDIEPVARSIRTVVTVATPHRGTPLAALFTSLLGQRLLYVLSLSTIYMLRVGRLPISILLEIAGFFARVNDSAHNRTLLDEVFARLLADFSIRRRQAVQRLFAEVAKDQALLLQLTPEAMAVFNSLVRNRPGTRYGSVITCSRPPGFLSALRAGIDPSAQATHAIYQALYRFAEQSPRSQMAKINDAQKRVIRRAYGGLPSLAANDGVIPTRSQVWGDVIEAVRADHLDVIGHFADPERAPPHIDWLTTGSGFTRTQFERLWRHVLGYIVGTGAESLLPAGKQGGIRR